MFPLTIPIRRVCRLSIGKLVDTKKKDCIRQLNLSRHMSIMTAVKYFGAFGYRPWYKDLNVFGHKVQFDMKIAH